MIRSLPLAGLLVLSACTMGPDYARPPSPVPQAEARGAFLRGGSDVASSAPAARWWEGLDDPVLNQLVDDALAHNPDLAIAEARIAQARAGLAASRTALLPSVGGGLVAPYVNLPAGALGINDDRRIDQLSYTAGFDASWELDLLGGNRRRIEAMAARVEAASASAADARVTLSAEVARAYVALRLRQRMALIQAEQADIDRDLVTLERQRVAAGTTTAPSMIQAQARLADTESALARTRAEATVLIDQIAALTGQEPGTLDTLLPAATPIPLPPAKVAVGDPAGLLRSRPDIRRAERQLAAATADIGVKEAARFPRISFMGLLGLGGPDIGGVVDPASLVSVALPRLRWSLFDGGRSAADLRAAEAGRDEAAATYRQTVLAALQDAENALARFGAQRLGYARALEILDLSARAVGLADQRATAGTASRRDSLGTRRQMLDSELATASARADLTIGFIAVEKALGLGWGQPVPGAPPSNN